jgi:hypothetical protein
MISGPLSTAKFMNGEWSVVSRSLRQIDPATFFFILDPMVITFANWTVNRHVHRNARDGERFTVGRSTDLLKFKTRKSVMNEDNRHSPLLCNKSITQRRKGAKSETIYGLLHSNAYFSCRFCAGSARKEYLRVAQDLQAKLLRYQSRRPPLVAVSPLTIRT